MPLATCHANIFIVFCCLGSKPCIIWPNCVLFAVRLLTFDALSALSRVAFGCIQFRELWLCAPLAIYLLSCRLPFDAWLCEIGPCAGQPSEPLYVPQCFGLWISSPLNFIWFLGYYGLQAVHVAAGFNSFLAHRISL